MKAKTIVLSLNWMLFSVLYQYVDSNIPDSWDCQNSKYLYPPAEHVITGTLNVISDARVRNIISKGP